MASETNPTIRDCLKRRSLPRLETSLLLAFVLGRSREWLIAHDDESLALDQYDAYLALEARRQQGEPIAYLVGQREFMSLLFAVDPAVLIPRPETELLVEKALEFISTVAKPEVLELGTGSGIIAICLAKALPNAQTTATDISEAALAVARQNAERLNVSVEFLAGEWFEALADRQRFDLIVSNPPYIHPQDPHLTQGDLRYEPKQALTDGVNGLAAFDIIISGARERLRPGGWLWLEHGFEQAQAVTQRLEQGGFNHIKTFFDVGGKPRVSGGSYNELDL